MLSVALTGGLACGKSTVARAFADLGVALLDTDKIVHELLAPGGRAVEPVLSEFPGCGDEAGGIDRRALGAIVFSDPAKRRLLESLMHPLVVAENRRRLQVFANNGVLIALTEVPLLFEAADSGSAGPDSLSRFDRVITVSCDPAVQLERAVARQGGDPGAARADAQRRIASQMSQEEKRNRADFNVDNSGPWEDVQDQVRSVHSQLMSIQSQHD